MIWEHFLPALIAAIPGTLALIYGTMRWEFPRLLKLLLTVLGIAVLIYGTLTLVLTGNVLPSATTWEHFLPALIAAIPGAVALSYGTMPREFPRSLKFALIIPFIAALIYATVTGGLTGKDLFAILAASSGIIALVWRLLDHHRSYLHVSLRVDLNENGFLSAVAGVENKSISKKNLSNALLLVGPEHEDSIETMRQFGFKNIIKHTNDIVKFKKARTGPNGRSLIPLPFFYSENIQIADEKVSYRAPIKTHDIPRGVPYSVRFFISAPERLHRSTHDSFVLPPPARKLDIARTNG